MQDIFHKISTRISMAVGSPPAFIVAVAVILLWLVSGPLFNFSDTWQLIINTSTTIITFLMVFLIQNTQNRDSRALHLKIDELVKAAKGARNSLVNIEEFTDDEIDQLEEEFRKISDKYRQAKKKS